MSTKEKENSDPIQEATLTKLFVDGVSKIKIQRCDNLFQQLETRSLTEEEQKTIDERVAFQRKLFEEYEKRELRRKVTELLEVCPQLTEEEVIKALELCNNREDDAATRLTSEAGFIQRVKAALQYEAGVPVTAVVKPRPQRQTGSRPKQDVSKLASQGVFVGSFRGKGYQKSFGSSSHSLENKQVVEHVTEPEEQALEPEQPLVPRARRSLRRKDKSSSATNSLQIELPTGELEASASLKEAVAEAVEVAGEDEQLPNCKGSQVAGTPACHKIEGVGQSVVKQEGGLSTKTPLSQPKKYVLVKQELNGATRPVTDSEIKRICKPIAEVETAPDAGQASEHLAEPSAVQDQGIGKGKPQTKSSITATVNILLKKNNADARKLIAHLHKLKASTLDDVLGELKGMPGEQAKQLITLVEAVQGEQANIQGVEKLHEPVEDTEQEQNKNDSDDVPCDPQTAGQQQESDEMTKVENDNQQSRPTRPQRSWATRGAAQVQQEEETTSDKPDNQEFQMKSVRRASGRRVPAKNRRQASLTDLFMPKGSDPDPVEEAKSQFQKSCAEKPAPDAVDSESEVATAAPMDEDTPAPTRKSHRLSLKRPQTRNQPTASGSMVKASASPSVPKAPTLKTDPDISGSSAATISADCPSKPVKEEGADSGPQPQTSGKQDEGPSEPPSKRQCKGRSERTLAISKRGHTCRGRVRQKSHKSAELVSLGKIRTGQGWFNAGYMFPEGFVSRIVFRSSVHLDQLCVHECYIIGAGGQFAPAPTFKVVAMDRPDEPLIARSCTGCWTAILKRINSEIEERRKAGEDLPPPPKTAIAGPEYFGLNQPEIVAAIEALDVEQKCEVYWRGKAEREAAAAGLTLQPREAGAARAPRQASTKPRTGKRGKRRTSEGSDEEQGNDEDDEADYVTNRWSAVNRGERYRKRCAEGDGVAGRDEDNPLPDFLDPITLEPVVCPAISPYGHVMGWSTWKAVFEGQDMGGEQGMCPFTKQPLSMMQLTKLTKNNIDRFADKIVK